MHRSTATVTLWCLLAPLAGFAQEGQRPVLSIGRTVDTRPVIDGIVDETVWDGAPPFSTFIQQEPNEGEPATERTEGLLQYNRQASTFSSNVRLALLNRSGTGLFLVYNDRRDTSAFTADELLGRSVIAKYTRLFDF